MSMADTASSRADCLGRSVGAVLVLSDRIVATGYNGVPSGMLNCTDGGCERCSSAERQAGSGYDNCICVHAEANALMTAARFGIGVEGATLYSTLQPCFTCAKEALQAGVARIVFGQEWEPSEALLKRQYRILLAHFSENVEQFIAE